MSNFYDRFQSFQMMICEKFFNSITSPSCTNNSDLAIDCTTSNGLDQPVSNASLVIRKPQLIFGAFLSTFRRFIEVIILKTVVAQWLVVHIQMTPFSPIIVATSQARVQQLAKL
jgi:hypothetical protein